MYCNDLQEQIMKDCNNLDRKINIAINYRKNNPPQKGQVKVHKSPLVKTDGPGVAINKIDIADNKEVINEFIKYSKDEGNDLPGRVKKYIKKFKKNEDGK